MRQFKSIYPSAYNDSVVLSRNLKDIATLAVEVPLIGMHSRLEQAKSSDIYASYELLKNYLTFGRVESLSFVNNH